MATTWQERVKPTTNWNERKKPEIYIAPLQDAYRIVHNEDDKIIYIISNEWQPVAITKWTARKPI